MSGDTPPTPPRGPRPPSNPTSPTDDSEPSNANGGGSFFSAEHNAWLDRRNHWPAGTAMDLYQADARLNAEARRVIRAQPAGAPPSFEEVNVGPPTYTQLPPGRGRRVRRTSTVDGFRRIDLQNRGASVDHGATAAALGVPRCFDDPNLTNGTVLDIIDGMGGWLAFEPRFRADLIASRIRVAELRGGSFDDAHDAQENGRIPSRRDVDRQIEALHQAWLARGERIAARDLARPDRTLGGRVRRPAGTSRRGSQMRNATAATTPSEATSPRRRHTAQAPDADADADDDNDEQGGVAIPHHEGRGTGTPSPQSPEEGRRSADAEARRERSRSRARRSHDRRSPARRH